MAYKNRVQHDTTVAFFTCITTDKDNGMSKLLTDIMVNDKIIKSSSYPYFGFNTVDTWERCHNMKYYIFLIRMVYDILCYDLPHIYCDQLIKEVKYPMIFNYGYIKRITGIDSAFGRYFYTRTHYINQRIKLKRSDHYFDYGMLIDVCVKRSNHLSQNINIKYYDEIQYGRKSLSRLAERFYNIKEEPSNAADEIQ